MSLKQYRSLDLLIFSLLAAASEFLGTYLLGTFFSGFSVSFASLIAIIAIFRWGLLGGIVYVVSGLPMLLLYKDSFLDNFIYYIAGNGFIFFVPIFVKRPLNRIRDKTFSFNLFIIAVYVAVAVGKALAGLVLGEPFFDALRAVGGSLLFTAVVSVILLNLLKKTSGLITDMYLLIEEAKAESAYETRSENV